MAKYSPPQFLVHQQGSPLADQWKRWIEPRKGQPYTHHRRWVRGSEKGESLPLPYLRIRGRLRSRCRASRPSTYVTLCLTQSMHSGARA